MTFEFKYLGDFEFIFENNLGSWSGDQELAFDEKKRMSKISSKCTFKVIFEKLLGFQLSSDRRQIFGEERTAHTEHCKKKIV
jgi:hypothetical protein